MMQFKDTLAFIGQFVLLVLFALVLHLLVGILYVWTVQCAYNKYSDLQYYAGGKRSTFSISVSVTPPTQKKEKRKTRPNRQMEQKVGLFALFRPKICLKNVEAFSNNSI